MAGCGLLDGLSASGRMYSPDVYLRWCLEHVLNDRGSICHAASGDQDSRCLSMWRMSSHMAASGLLLPQVIFQIFELSHGAQILHKRWKLKNISNKIIELRCAINNACAFPFAICMTSARQIYFSNLFKIYDFILLKPTLSNSKSDGATIVTQPASLITCLSGLLHHACDLQTIAARNE